MQRIFTIGVATAMLSLAFAVPSVHAQKHDQYVLTASEVAEKQEIKTVYEAIRMLRPRWLRPVRSRGALAGANLSRKSPSFNADRDPASDGRPAPDASASAPPAAQPGDYSDPEMASGGPVLYVDDVKQPNMDEMKSFPVSQVIEMRYMTGNDASGRYGAGHEGGAILIKTNRSK